MASRNADATTQSIETDKAVVSALSKPSFERAPTSFGSHTPLLHRHGEIRTPAAYELHQIKCDVMVNWLYQQQMERLWTAGGEDEGVVLKKARGAYTCCPQNLIEEPLGFFRAIEALNVRVS